MFADDGSFGRADGCGDFFECREFYAADRAEAADEDFARGRADAGKAGIGGGGLHAFFKSACSYEAVTFTREEHEHAFGVS